MSTHIKTKPSEKGGFVFMFDEMFSFMYCLKKTNKTMLL
jgi:hypothetical protein